MLNGYILKESRLVMYNTPILFLIFNRPDTTEKVFEKIREIKPKQLFIAADGPRNGNERDKLSCKATREIATNVDWDCELKTLFRDGNLGCGRAVSEAITWFFENVEEGIILEDDCLPNTSFFKFCQEILKKYRFDHDVLHVCGSNYQYGKWRGKGDYYFSKLTHIWGWATWKRAWDKYEFTIEGEDYLISKAYPLKTDVLVRQEWEKAFKYFRANCVDTWDYQWLLACWKHGGITIIPNKNLIFNLGFGHEATHTLFYPAYYKKIKHEYLLGEIRHPSEITINYKADAFEQKVRMGQNSVIRSFLRNTKKILKGILVKYQV